jgi:prophage tail gpP-like protein
MYKTTISGKNKNDFTLFIDNREIPVVNARLMKTIDSIANSATATIAWTPGLDSELDRITAPFYYPSCAIYLGGILQMVGILYNVTQRLDQNGRTKQFEMWSKTANVIDSSVRYPFEENNIDLFERIVSQMNSPVVGRSMEIDVHTDLDVGGKFSRISVKQTDNCFAKLKELAAQRGLLLSCTVEGDILIIRPKTTGQPIGTITEESGITNIFEVTFNGRGRFKNYESIASSSKKGRSRKKQTAADVVVTTPRFLTFSADDSLPGEAINAALWKKNKSAADAMQITLPVNTWYGPDKNLWIENTLLTVKSETMSIPDGFTFLISRVEFVFDSNGANSQIELKPPTVYTTGEITEPWLST